MQDADVGRNSRSVVIAPSAAQRTIAQIKAHTVPRQRIDGGQMKKSWSWTDVLARADHRVARDKLQRPRLPSQGQFNAVRTPKSARHALASSCAADRNFPNALEAELAAYLGRMEVPASGQRPSRRAAEPAKTGRNPSPLRQSKPPAPQQPVRGVRWERNIAVIALAAGVTAYAYGQLEAYWASLHSGRQREQVQPHAKQLPSPLVTPSAPATAHAEKESFEDAIALLVNGQVPAAREILRKRVARGDAEAAVMLGQSYDPRFVSRANSRYADPEQAKLWYVKAKELGSELGFRRLVELLLAGKR